MNTVVIWDQCGASPITFFLLAGDQSRFDGVYLNCDYDSGDPADDERMLNLSFELEDLVYCSGREIVDFISKDAFVEQLKNGAKLIKCGCIP